MRVIPSTLAKAMVIRHHMPRIAAVIRTINPAFFRLDHCPHPVGIRARYRDPDAPENALRQPVTFELFPGRSAVARTVKSATRPAAVQTPRGPPCLPQCR